MPGRNNPNQPQEQPNGPLIPNDGPGADEVFEGENLNINAIIEEAQPKKGTAPDESRREVKFIPETRSADDLIYDTVLAVDEHGNSWTEHEDIKKQLSKNGCRLFLFDQDGEPPYAIENRKGKLYSSDEGISSHNQLPGNFFIPAGSLDSDRIYGGPSKRRISELNDKVNKAKLEYETKSAEPRRQRKELNDQIKQLEKTAPKLKVPKPKEPKFGWGRTLQRWAYKLITFGTGETKAYRKYQEDMAQYNVKNQEYKDARTKFKTENEAYQNKKNVLDEKLETLNTEIDMLHVPLKTAEEARDRAVESHMKGRKEGTKKVREYRENLEVLLEGTADMIKQGKITKDNVFANTWLKKAACEGKDPSDPESQKALEEYLASKMTEEKLLHQTMSSDLDSRSRAEEESMLRALNSGNATKQIQDSREYRDALEESEVLGEYIDPEGIYEVMTDQINKKIIKDKTAVGQLENAKKLLIDEFGTKPITKGCLRKVMDMNKLNEAIKIAKKDSNFTPQTAHAVITDLYLEPGKQRTYFANAMSEEDTKKVIQSLAGKQDKKEYTLDEMTNLINDTHQAQKKAPQQNAPSQVLS